MSLTHSSDDESLVAPAPAEDRGEAARLFALHQTGLLDTSPEEEFDELVRLASFICGTPIALLSLVDAERQWFKSRVGLDALQTPRDQSFCAHTIRDDKVMVVTDATADPRFADNPLVTGEPGIRFYAGAPLETSDGHRLGTLCVIDRVPRQLTPEQEQALRLLSRQLVKQILLRRLIREQAQTTRQLRLAEEELRASNHRFATFMDNSPAVVYMKDKEGYFVYTNRTLHLRFRDQPATWVGRRDVDFWPPEVTDEVRRVDRLVLDSGELVVTQEQVPLEGQIHHWLSYKFPVEGTDGQRFLGGMSIDISERIEAENEAERARSALAVQVDELHDRTRQLVLLGEMGEMLQSCQDLDEAYAVIGSRLMQLFPGGGSLSTLNASRTVVDSVAVWGENEGGAFAPDDCWGLRRGRAHVFQQSGHDIACRHAVSSDGFSTICAPIVAHHETLGLLHFRAPSGFWTTDRQQVVRTVAEQIALALANLKLQEKLRDQSIRDALTGLFNRRYLEESLEREFHRANRSGHPLSVIMFDVDHFKSFNDNFGHEAGDVLLRELGAFIPAIIRKSDIACRFGGEEFAVLLPELSIEEALVRAEDLRQGVAKLQPEFRGQPLKGATISVGVASLPLHAQNGKDLVLIADRALYEAKRMGRNCVVAARSHEAG